MKSAVLNQSLQHNGMKLISRRHYNLRMTLNLSLRLYGCWFVPGKTLKKIQMDQNLQQPGGQLPQGPSMAQRMHELCLSRYCLSGLRA